MTPSVFSFVVVAARPKRGPEAFFYEKRAWATILYKSRMNLLKYESSPAIVAYYFRLNEQESKSNIARPKAMMVNDNISHLVCRQERENRVGRGSKGAGF